MAARDLGLLHAALWLSVVSACDQPVPQCNVGHGAYWATYTLVSGEGACAQLTGEELDVHSYYAPRSASDPRPNYEAVSIGIQPASITAALGNAAGIAEPDADDKPYALGLFTTKTPAADLCIAPKLSSARLRLPAVPEHALDMCTTAPDAPGYDLTYTFSNIRVYFTARAAGTQFTADLTYTQDDCTAQYQVIALNPIVSCGAPGLAADGGMQADSVDAAVIDEDSGMAADVDAGADCPVPEPEPETGPSVADDSLCENSGINPDFALTCDRASLTCVLRGAPPSLK